MRLRTLLGHIDEAESAGDLSGASLVFAVIRNESAALDSPEAWDAVSIVGLKVDSQDGSVDLLADDSEAARDISVASLRARASKLSADVREQDVFVGMVGQAEAASGARENMPVVEAFGDENGLGLMVWFEGYEDWLQSQS